MIVKALEDRAIFNIGDGKTGTLREYGDKVTKAIKKSKASDTDPIKASADEIVEEFFPKIDRGPVAYNASLIDLIDNIRSDSPGPEGKQFVLPKYTNVPKDKLQHFKGPTTSELLRMFDANYAKGGTADFEEFKTLLLNRAYDQLEVDPEDYLERIDKPMSIKEAHSFGDRSYDDIDLKETLFKVIEDKTANNIGLGALFQEEMDDRKRGFSA